MDAQWFKQRQKAVGVTADEIAAIRGRSRTNVSHILNGRQRMSMAWAKAFAEALDVPLNEVLEHAGELDRPEAQPLKPGFSDSDAAQWEGGKSDAAKVRGVVAALGCDRPGVDVWTVKGGALALAGYLPGDMIAVDTHQAERCAPGDAVIAQVYDWQAGTASTVLRRFEPPVLVAASADPGDQRVHVIDGNNVVVRGKVVASWRE